MDIKDCRIDMMVKAPNGYDAKIVEIQKSGRVFVDFSPRGYNYMPFAASELTPVSDPCADCQKLEAAKLKAFWEGQAAAKADVGNALDVLRKDRDNWKQLAETRCDNCQRIIELRQDRDRWWHLSESYKRNATHWREELTKMQKEALECNPLGEVAKIYIQVSPDELRRILKGRD